MDNIVTIVNFQLDAQNSLFICV